MNIDRLINKDYSALNLRWILYKDHKYLLNLFKYIYKLSLFV
jgi:hypothetical protein